MMLLGPAECCWVLLGFQHTPRPLLSVPSCSTGETPRPEQEVFALAADLLIIWYIFVFKGSFRK